MLGLYDDCENDEVTSPRIVHLKQNQTGAVPNESDFATSDYRVSESVQKGDLVSIYTDDNDYDYYLLKATQKCRELTESANDDYNNYFQGSSTVISGQYYAKVDRNTYKLITNKTAIVSASSVLSIVDEVKALRKITIPENVHENLIGWIDECANV